MEKQMNIFDDSPNNDSHKKESENEQASYKRLHTYKITKTRKSLHTIGEQLASRYNWITNGIVPYAASNVIHVDYHLDYDTIQDLYDQNRIITYQVDDTFTTWINKSVKKKNKSNHHKGHDSNNH